MLKKAVIAASALVIAGTSLTVSTRSASANPLAVLALGALAAGTLAATASAAPYAYHTGYWAPGYYPGSYCYDSTRRVKTKRGRVIIEPVTVCR